MKYKINNSFADYNSTTVDAATEMRCNFVLPDNYTAAANYPVAKQKFILKKQKFILKKQKFILKKQKFIIKK